MLCERILGTIDTYAAGGPGREIDYVEIEWWELDRRALRKISAGGLALRILLPLGEALADGQVLSDDGRTLVVLRVKPTEVLVVSPADPASMGIVCLELGNLHAPAEVAGDEVLVIPDGPVEQALLELNLAYRREVRLFQPRRCAGMPQLQMSPNFEVFRSSKRL